MRPLLSWALLLVAVAACSSDRRADSSTQSAVSSSSRGPDPIVLRVARSGGPVRAYRYPGLDTAIWASEPAPAIDHVIGFDPDAGSLAFVDLKGVPRRVDLRVGGVNAAGKASLKLTDLNSGDGSSIFGVSPAAAIVRLAPSGEAWTFAPQSGAREAFPQPDGSVIILGGKRDRSVLWRVRPPGARAIDSLVLTVTPLADGAHTQAGDRIYIESEDGLVGVRARDLSASVPVAVGGRIRSIVATPSGDRLFAALEDGKQLVVIDRYRDRVQAQIDLPDEPGALRMDPLGRYLLARIGRKDSAWVVAVGTNRPIGSVATRWLADLPLVAPDGALLLAHGEDVAVVDGETLQPRRTVVGGARDYWSVIMWNGFRPRANGIDQPVTFAGGGSDSAASDSVADSTAGTAIDSAIAAPHDSVPPAPSSAHGFVVSFSSLLSEEKARSDASQIRVGGQSARIEQAQVAGRTVFRVVLGPYANRGEAERVGRESGRNYWVVEDKP